MVDRLGSSADFGGDLHPAVHRARDACTIACRPASPYGARPSRTGASTPAPIGKNPPAMRSRCTRSIITDVAVGENGIQVEDAAHRPAATPARHEGGRGDQGDPGAKVVSSSTLDRATRLCSTSPTMATCRPSRSPVAPEPAPQGERVQQRLGRVLVGAVAGVDHAASTQPAIRCSRTGGGMPHHQGVHAHRGDRQRGVAQALALAARSEPLALTLIDVGGQPLGRQFEGRSGSASSPRRTGLQPSDRAAAEAS